jgi:hypothetical protein
VLVEFETAVGKIIDKTAAALDMRLFLGYFKVWRKT